jgi:protein TonB
MKKRLVKLIPILSGFVLITGITAGVVVFISGMLQEAPHKKKMVQQISLIKPPPPPPPPKIEKPPEPEVEKVKVEEPETPEEIPDAPSDDMPAGDLLGLDADGVAGGDGFGLIGKKGGRSLLGSDSNNFKWYTNRVGSFIEDKLYNFSENEEFKILRNEKYTAKVNIWIDDNLNLHGKLIESTGNNQRDKAIREVLASLGQYNEKVPDSMEQPLRILIRSRL